MKVGQVVEYRPNQTITYGGLNGLGAISTGAVSSTSSKDEVIKVQSWLAKVGYPIAADGLYGPKTAMAVLFVQRKLNAKAGSRVLAENGQWDAATNTRASAQTQADIVQPNQTERGKVQNATTASLIAEVRGTPSGGQVGTTVTNTDVSVYAPPVTAPPVPAPPAQTPPGAQPAGQSWLDKLPLPAQLKNPWVLGGVAVGVVLIGAALFSGGSKPAPAPVMGFGGWDDMPKPKRKKRRKSRKSKK